MSRSVYFSCYGKWTKKYENKNQILLLARDIGVNIVDQRGLITGTKLDNGEVLQITLDRSVMQGKSIYDESKNYDLNGIYGVLELDNIPVFIYLTCENNSFTIDFEILNGYRCKSDGKPDLNWITENFCRLVKKNMHIEGYKISIDGDTNE